MELISLVYEILILTIVLLLIVILVSYVLSRIRNKSQRNDDNSFSTLPKRVRTSYENLAATVFIPTNHSSPTNNYRPRELKVVRKQTVFDVTVDDGLRRKDRNISDSENRIVNNRFKIINDRKKDF